MKNSLKIEIKKPLPRERVYEFHSMVNSNHSTLIVDQKTHSFPERKPMVYEVQTYGLALVNMVFSVAIGVRLLL